MNNRKRYLQRQRRLQLAGLACLALVCIALLPLLLLSLLKAPAIVAGGACLAAAPLILDKGDVDFEAKVLAGVEALNAENKALQTRYDKVVADLDRSDKEVKKAMEELTLVKNKTNTSYEEVMKSYESLQKAVRLNARSSFTDPVEKALANEETRFYFNAMARYCVAQHNNELHRLPAEMRKAIEEGNASVKSLTGVDSSLGQATVPTQTFNEIYDLLLEYGDWSSLGVQRVGARTTVLPVGTARPQFYWIGSGTGGTGESSAITAGAFTGSSVNLIIQTLAAYLTVSRELLADSTVDLAPYITREIAQAISFGLDTAAFISAGAANQTDAGYTGLFNADSVNVNCAAGASAGSVKVSKLLLDDFVRCLTTVSPIVLKRKPRWWMHPQVLASVALIRDNNGRPIFQTWQEVPSGSIASILGYPVTSTAVAPTAALTTISSAAAVFGDPMGQAVGIRSDLELATSDDIKFAENMRAFRALMRCGVKLKTATASATLIPFAVLKTAAA
jgi:HK97 family phage major capsid protein